jgi:LysM repeat protein
LAALLALHSLNGTLALLRQIILRVEGHLTNKLGRAIGALASLSDGVDRLVAESAPRIQAARKWLQAHNPRHRHPRFAWLFVLFTLFPIFEYTAQEGKERFGDTYFYQFVCRSLAWWHSAEHLILSGSLPTPSAANNCVQLRAPHIVKPGETLARIAATYRITYHEIILDNLDKFPPFLPRLLPTGEKLPLPGSSSSTISVQPPLVSLTPNGLPPGLALRIPVGPPIK